MFKKILSITLCSICIFMAGEQYLSKPPKRRFQTQYQSRWKRILLLNISETLIGV